MRLRTSIHRACRRTTNQLLTGLRKLPALRARSLEARLRAAVCVLSAGRAPTSTDHELRRSLLELYTEDERADVWQRRLAPFLSAHQSDLAVLYDRQRRLRNPLLDELEALLVLERLTASPTRLSETWARAPIELERLAQNWATTLR